MKDVPSQIVGDLMIGDAYLKPNQRRCCLTLANSGLRGARLPPSVPYQRVKEARPCDKQRLVEGKRHESLR